MSGQYYKHWWTPLCLYAIIETIVRLIADTDIKLIIANLIGVAAAIILLEIVYRIADKISKVTRKRRCKRLGITPKVSLTVVTDIECPENMEQEIKDKLYSAIKDIIKEYSDTNIESTKTIRS